MSKQRFETHQLVKKGISGIICEVVLYEPKNDKYLIIVERSAYSYMWIEASRLSPLF